MDLLKKCFTRDNNKSKEVNKLNINIDKVNINHDKGPQLIRNDN